jgi:hypothetical protein
MTGNCGGVGVACVFQKKASTMAIIKDNIIVSGLQGTIGNYVFRRRGDVIVVYPKPERKAPFTDEQKEYQTKFGAAVKYAQSVIKNDAEAAIYKKIAKRMKKKNIYAAAISDFMKEMKFRKEYDSEQEQ